MSAPWLHDVGLRHRAVLAPLAALGAAWNAAGVVTGVDGSELAMLAVVNTCFDLGRLR